MLYMNLLLLVVLDIQPFAIQFAPVVAIWFPSGFVDFGVFEVKAEPHTYWSDIVHLEQHKKIQPKISSVQVCLTTLDLQTRGQFYMW